MKKEVSIYSSIDKITQMHRTQFVYSDRETIIFDNDFNDIIPVEKIRGCVINVIFGDRFNHESINNLPDHIRHITLGRGFDIPITKIPKDLESIRVYQSYPHDLPGKILITIY